MLSTWISLRRASINFLSRSYHGVWASGKRRGLCLRATRICPLAGISFIFHLSAVKESQRQLAEVDVHLILRMESKMRKTWNKLGRKN